MRREYIGKLNNKKFLCFEDWDQSYEGWRKGSQIMYLARKVHLVYIKCKNSTTQLKLTLKRYFSKKTYKQLTVEKIPFIIMKRKSETYSKIPFIFTRMTTTKKVSVHKDVEKLEPSYIASGKVKCMQFLWESLAFPHDIKELTTTMSTATQVPQRIETMDIQKLEYEY